MRALDPRRPQPTSTFYLFPRSFFCLLFLLFILGAAHARSVTRDGEDTVQPTAKISLVENEAGAVKKEPTTGIDGPERIQGKLAEVRDDEASGNEKIVSEESEDTDPKVTQAVVARRGHDREDDTASVRGAGIEDRWKKIDEVVAGQVPKQGDEDVNVAKKRRRNDVALGGKSEIQENESEGIRRFDVRLDTEGIASGIAEMPLRKQETVQSIESVKEEHVSKVDESKATIPNYFRKSAILEEDGDKSEDKSASSESFESAESEEYDSHRGYRSLTEAQDKPKRKSSTVYLNAEEKKISDGEQQSIVDGQIKKLISIRDDALDAQKSEKMDETQLLSSKKEAGADEITITRDELQNQRKSKVNDTIETHTERSIGVGGGLGGGLLRTWKDQAISLQGQIKDRTFLSNLKEPTSNVLPAIPKFTENQLLIALEQIVLSKRLEPLNEFYANNMKELGLSENQLRIVKCAEQLVATGDRRSFVDNLTDCIRGLSILNCMRIFVWPIVVDNLPPYITNTLPSLPIEVNVFDLFQGSTQKSARAHDLHRIRLLTPDSMVYNILQDALETYPSDETLISYVDPTNQTLKTLLSTDQMHILQMAEKFLPQTLRQDYSDKMYSCVRRFEYFSCVKYFAWPLIKQYFPALPAFPDYQTWYPLVDLSPQYPIFPFPSFSEDVGELPEVVDADATRAKKPRPETMIIQVLQNTLKEQARVSVSPSFFDHSPDTYITLIPEDQLLTINMAEQLIPISQRSEFIEKTVRCMKEYNYLTCFKYSSWPTVRRFIPTLPDISSLLPDFLVPRLSNINSYISEVPTYSGYYYAPIDGADGQQETIQPDYGLKTRANTMRSTDELETQILEILQRARSSVDKDKSKEGTARSLTANGMKFATLTAKQIKILQLAESLVPDSARPALDAEILAYLERNDNFIDGARYVIWPILSKYVPTLPQFPGQEAGKNSSDMGNVQSLLTVKGAAINSPVTIQERFSIDSDKKETATALVQDEESRNKVTNVPVINVSGIRFVPLFTDHPETVLLNILRSVQLQSLKTNTGTTSITTKNQQFLNLLNDQQVNIVNIVDSLLPESIRPNFANKLIECLRVNNFLICTRDVVWPTVSQYFPWLPSFPDFGFLVGPATNPSSSTSQTITEPSSSSDRPPLSETNVKTGQHGDTTVTVTDTRFLPILSELPETIILNILKAVQLSIPNLSGSQSPMRIQDFSAQLTEQQINIIQIAENLLPIPTRPQFINRISPCIKERNFLECTRDITWPIIAQSYPWLPSFPNFGSLKSSPQLPGSNPVQFQVFLSEKPPLANFDSRSLQSSLTKQFETVVLRESEQKIESTLQILLSEAPTLDKSYLMANDPALSLLTKQQISIIRLVEKGIPDAARPSFLSRMLQCVTRYNFIACTNSIAWPTLKEYVPLLPDLSTVAQLLSQLPGILQIPSDQIPSDAGHVSVLPDPATLTSAISGLSQLPAAIPQLPLPFGVLTEPKYRTDQILNSRADAQKSATTGSSSSTPSVDNEGIVPGYAGQPPGIFVNLQNEAVHIPDNGQRQEPAADVKTRNRRSTMDIPNSYYETKPASESSDSSNQIFPNITESDYLQLLIRVKEIARLSSETSSNPKEYFVDTLNSTVRNSLTADQYEILKIVDELDIQRSGKGLASQVIQCITGLSFIRCLGIFIWPLITNNLPSLIGFPSLPSFGFLGRSLATEDQVQNFFGMTSSEFEKELLERKGSIEESLLDWYKKLAVDKFRMDMGFVKITGYGNNELGISFSGFREGRGAKLKDNKNLPSILTIISDIMEEVLDQRPEGEKTKKEKKDRSIRDSKESDIQFLKDSEEYIDIKRSMNDDDIITTFLNKIKTNDSELDNDDVKYITPEDAYNAFGVLFGTKLHGKPSDNADTFELPLASLEEVPVDPSRGVDIVSLESQRGSDQLEVLPLKSEVAYDFERESTKDQEGRQRQKRAKDLFKSFLEKHSDKYLKDSDKESFEDNKIVEDRDEKHAKQSLVVQLPRLDDEFISKKVTNSMNHLGKVFNSKMTQMMPGFGLILSFLLQLGLAHARAAASMAGMISNMALGSAMFGMIRDSMFGSNSHPQIKYVYDNDKMGPGVSWPTQYHSGSHYYG